MIAVKVFLENGTDYTTPINGSIENAREYFVGKYLNFGVEGDKMVKVLKVEEVTN